MKKRLMIGILAMFFAVPALAYQAVLVTVHRIDGQGVHEAIGAIDLFDGMEGISVRPSLSRLVPGSHSVYIHEKPDCGPAIRDGKAIAGLAAGERFDPPVTVTGKLKMKGRPARMPNITVAEDGSHAFQLFKPGLQVGSLRGRSLVIYEQTDDPADPSSDAGARIACGVIP
jgi:superoxide dismutase, Cu-Zn family